MLAAALFVSACNETEDAYLGNNESPDDGELSEKERAELVTEICELHCEYYMDPLCGPQFEGEHPFADVEECLDICVSMEYEPPGGPGHWGDDSKCGAEHRAHVRCVAAMSCEERRDVYYSDNIDQSSCHDILMAASRCSTGLADDRG